MAKREATPEELTAIEAAPSTKREATPEEAAALDAPAPAPAEPSFWQKAARTLGVSSASEDTGDQAISSRLMAAQNGATQGLAPIINALGETGLRSVLHGVAPETFDDTTYKQALKKNQGLYGAASNAHPVTDIVGSFANPLVPKISGGGVVGRGLKFGAVGAEQLATRKLGQASGESNNALDDAWKHTSPLELGLSVGLPSVVGGATGVPWTKLADDMALRATGLKGGITNKLQKMGYETADDAQQLGNAIRKEGLVPWFGGSKEVAENAEKLQQTGGGKIGEAISAADASGVAPDFQAPVVAARKGLMAESPVARQAGGKLEGLLDTVENTPKQLVNSSGLARKATFKDLNDAKADAWKSASMDSEAPVAPVLYRQGVGRMAGDIERQVEAAAGQKAAQQLAEGNRQYGLAKDVKRITSDVGTRDAHRSMLPEIIAAGSGGALGGPALGHGTMGGAAGALMASLATHLAKTHGPAFMTNAAQLAEPLESAASHVRGADSLAEYLSLLKKNEDQ